jgi:hypothetical protein
MPFLIDDYFLLACFCYFVKTNLGKNKILRHKFSFSKNTFAKIPTTAYNMKGCLRFPTFIF